MISGFNFYNIEDSDVKSVNDEVIKLNKIPPFLKTVNKKPLILNLNTELFKNTVVLNYNNGEYGCLAAFGNSLVNVILAIDTDGYAVFKLLRL